MRFLVLLALAAHTASWQPSLGGGVAASVRRRTTTPRLPAASPRCSLADPEPSTASVQSDSAPEPPTTPTVGGGEVVREQLRIFWKLAGPFFKEAEGAKLQAGILLGLVLLNSGVSVLFSYTSRDFWTALSSKDVQQFYELTARFAGALAIATPVSVLYRWQRARLSVSWREWMTTEVSRQYYADQAYYKLELERDVDNPDQRIAEDVKAFTRVSLDFFITLLTAAIDIVSFSSILYSIYPNLFYAIFAYAGLGTLGTVQLGKPLVKQNAEQLQREADFRYSLVRLRENAESIAFYHGEKQEGAEVGRRLERVISNLRELLVTQRNLEFFTTGYRYLIQILPILVVAPLYFAGSIELGVISQSSGAFNHVLNDLSILINEFEALSSFSAGLGRLGSFVSRMETLSPNASAIATFNLTDIPPPASAQAPLQPSADQPLSAADAAAYSCLEEIGGGVLSLEGCLLEPGVAGAGLLSLSKVRTVETPRESHGQPPLEIQGLSLLTPGGERLLLSNVSVRVDEGAHLLIMGPSGTGKSSLLRAVAGLWDRGEGQIKRPSLDDLVFLPQRPYCTLGSLREQLYYPRAAVAHSDAAELRAEETRLLEALETVQLGGLVARLAAEELRRQRAKEASDEAAAKGEVAASEAEAAVASEVALARLGLDAVRDWGDMLSLGEQQRLTFARLLVNKPKLAVLDEASSALDLPNEALMYAALAKVPGLTYISVGHRPSLKEYHRQVLELSPPAADEQAAATAAAAAPV